MFGAAEVLRNDKQALARLITEEMGKPISAAEAEIEKCAWNCEFYATRAAEFLAQREVDADASKSYIRYDPLGVVFAIMPWNYPSFAPKPMSPLLRSSSHGTVSSDSGWSF